ncbi:MAG: HAD-IA family hydrolase [Deltaproteobacteria bacterium]|nr:HAD-IA family hydrolase [Deltaproteobacteria bacterium]
MSVLICFDLGGVLLRICRSWAEGCEAAGVEPREHRIEPLEQERFGELVDRFQRDELGVEAFHGALSELLGGVWSPPEVARIDRAWIRGPYLGTRELVEALRGAGHTTACLSNTSRSHWERLLADPAVAALDHQHASHLLGLVKPDPRIYEAFEADVGLPGEEIVFFDDLPANVDAALARGWDAVRIDHRHETVPQMRAALHERGLL